MDKEYRQHLLTAINYLAPTGLVQARFVKMLHEMEEAGETEKYIARALVNALADGLNHGNWPS